MIQEKTNECIGGDPESKGPQNYKQRSWSNAEGRKEDQKDLLSLNLKHKRQKDIGLGSGASREWQQYFLGCQEEVAGKLEDLTEGQCGRR